MAQNWGLKAILAIIIPNNRITEGTIINYSSKETRRIDLTIGVSYSDDLGTVRRVLESILTEDSRILDDPAPTIGVADLADSSINFVVRPWVASADYWPTRFDLNQKIKECFEDAGITIPFPQQVVHLSPSKCSEGNGTETVPIS